MKRYIRASFDSSMPEWVRTKFNKSRGRWGDAFVKRYGIALADAKFLDHDPGNGIPIYLLNIPGNGEEVYIPGVNDENTVIVNGRSRKLGSISKANLNAFTSDVVWVDGAKVNRTPYIDPRRSYYYDGKQGSYAGQYKHTADGKWSKEGARPGNESGSRDKSGYKIPKPEIKLARYYKKFPDKIRTKVDSIYNRILQTKDIVFDPEFINTPWERNSSSDPGNAIYRVRDAIDSYRHLLAWLEEKGDTPFENRDFVKFSNFLKDIKYHLDEAEDNMQHKFYEGV